MGSCKPDGVRVLLPGRLLAPFKARPIEHIYIIYNKIDNSLSTSSTDATSVLEDFCIESERS